MLSNIRKKVFNKFPLLSRLRNDILTRQTIEQFDEADFEVTKEGSTRNIRFTDRLGYPLPDLNASFGFNSGAGLYDVVLNGTHILTGTFPLPEIVRELRGYLLAGFPPAGKAIVDIGASNGFITMALASLAGKTSPVFAFEPDQQYRELLLKNIGANGFPNISVSHQCIYNKSGTFGFVSRGDGSSSLTEDHAGTETVEAITLKDFFKNKGLSTRDLGFLKMDIEGAEVELLDDIFDIVNENHSCIVAIASYHLVNNELTSGIIERKAKDHQSVYVKTCYPYHRTTFITNVNSAFVKRLSKLL